jgi:hypothetical protein
MIKGYGSAATNLYERNNFLPSCFSGSLVLRSRDFSKYNPILTWPKIGGWKMSIIIFKNVQWKSIFFLRTIGLRFSLYQKLSKLRKKKSCAAFLPIFVMKSGARTIKHIYFVSLDIYLHSSIFSLYKPPKTSSVKRKQTKHCLRFINK